MPHKESKPGFLSVTEVLSLVIDKPFLRYWYGKNGTELCEQIKKESQELGINVHAMIESRFNTGEMSVPCTGRQIDMVNNLWNKFVIPWEVKPIKLEETYEDEHLKLQGTLDVVLDTNKGQYIVDFKTSNQLDKVSVPLQLAAYAQLSGEGIWKGLAIRIDKEKDIIEIKEYKDLTPYWSVFVDCLRIAQYIKFGLQEE